MTLERAMLILLCDAAADGCWDARHSRSDAEVQHGTTWAACRNDRCGTGSGFSVAAHPRTACRERPLGAASV